MLPRQAQEQGLIADVVILQIGQFLLLRKRDKSQVNIACLLYTSDAADEL